MPDEVKHAPGHTIDDELAKLLGDSESAVTVEEIAISEDALPTITDAVKHLRALRDQKTSTEAILSDINKQIAVLAAQIVDLMRVAGLQSMNLPGVGTAYIATVLAPRVLDPEEFLKWAKETIPESVKETVHSQTLKSILKERVEGGQSLPPPEIVEVKYFSDVRLLRK